MTTKIDWKEIIAELTGSGGWQEAEGPETGVGIVDYWVDDLDKTVRLHTDQGAYVLWLLPADSEAEDERLVWKGDLESLQQDPLLCRFVSTVPGDAAPPEL